MKALEEIQAILNGVIEKSKKLYTFNPKTKEAEWKGIPDYYEGYRKAVNQLNRIETHAEVDKFPEMLFEHRAPNQSAEENKYIRDNYKNTTHSVFSDYISATSRGLNDHNWNIEYPENDDYNEYIAEDIDVFYSVESYVKSVVPTLRAKDANGVMTFEIKEPKMVEVNGELQPDDREAYEPQPKYYSSPQVVAWKWDEYGMFESHEKSVVMMYNQPVKIGRVFYFYDDANIWEIRQVGKFVDHTFEYTLIFNHDLGYFPCQKLKGVPSIKKDGDIYYTSRFYFAVDSLDWSLLYSNYLNATIANVCFPFRWMVGDVCDYQDSNGAACHNGQVSSFVGEESVMKACPSCKGAGMKPRVSSMGTYLLKPSEGQDEGDAAFSAPMAYVSPETDTLEFTDQKAQDYKESGREILHLKTSNSRVKGNEEETALGRILDTKTMQAFLHPDSDQTFDVWQFLLDVIGKVREGKDFEGAKLIYPRTFDIRTDADILEDIKLAREAGAPPHIINTLMYQYVTNRYFAEHDTARVNELITSADRLLTLSSEEIVQRKAQMAVESWEIILHDSAFILIDKLIQENPNFLELELSEQINQLETKAKALVPKGQSLRDIARRVVDEPRLIDE